MPMYLNKKRSLFGLYSQRLRSALIPGSLPRISLMLPVNDLSLLHNRKPTLYIFMVDVSSSMTGSKVSKQEMERYLGEIDADHLRQARSPVVSACFMATRQPASILLAPSCVAISPLFR